MTFVPSAAGSYTITASYGGGPGHDSSSGAGSVTALPVGGLGKATIPKITISGTSARVRIACKGHAGQRCPVTMKMFLPGPGVTRRGGSRVVMLSFASKAVVVGKASETVAAGKTAVVKMPLNSLGKRLLAKSHKLRVVLVAREKSKKIATRKLTFKSKTH